MRCLLKASFKYITGDISFTRVRNIVSCSKLHQESVSYKEHEVSTPSFRCQEENPLNHTVNHEGQFYKLSKEIQDRLFPKDVMNRCFRKQAKAMDDCSIMVRKPALEVIHYLQNANYNAPVIRYLLYGQNGVGKSFTLHHLLHYASNADYMVVHHSWAPMWIRMYQDHVLSETRPPRMDTPTDSVLWLQQFKIQNSKMIEKFKLCTVGSYTWSKRETTEIGDSLLNLIDLGVTRPKFSSDCIAVLLKEIKLQSMMRKFKTFVAVDGINSFFDVTKMKRPDKSRVTPDDMTTVHAFRKLLKNDWNSGAVVGIVDKIANNIDKRETYLPRYLLGKEGFEWLDPFVPVQVHNYSDKEVQSCLDYYTNNLWIQHDEGKTDQGRQELIFLSGRNPEDLREICKSL